MHDAVTDIGYSLSIITLGSFFSFTVPQTQNPHAQQTGRHGHHRHRPQGVVVLLPHTPKQQRQWRRRYVSRPPFSSTTAALLTQIHTHPTTTLPHPFPPAKASAQAAEAKGAGDRSQRRRQRERLEKEYDAPVSTGLAPPPPSSSSFPSASTWLATGGGGGGGTGRLVSAVCVCV